MKSGARSTVVSSFTIIKGSMIEETYTVFSDWDFGRTREENLQRMRKTNSIGARSESWLRDVYKVLHRRFDPNGRDRALVELAQARCSYTVWKPILLWHMTRDEFLVRDFLVHWLFTAFQDGALRVRTEDLLPYLRGLEARSFVQEPWTDATLRRVASGLLRIAADFDLLRGKQSHEFASFHLPEESFLYLLHAQAEIQPNAYELIHSDDWHLFLMSSTDVERELFRLHQYQKLSYNTAGTLAQLSLPCESALSYAREIAA